MFDIAHPHDKLVSAAYAEATWKKILSAFNTFRKFCIESDSNPSFPISEKTLGHFINWATFDKNLNPSTVSAYMSHIRLLHKLQGLSTEGCDSFLCKVQIRGAQNLQFKKKVAVEPRK